MIITGFLLCWAGNPVLLWDQSDSRSDGETPIEHAWKNDSLHVWMTFDKNTPDEVQVVHLIRGAGVLDPDSLIYTDDVGWSTYTKVHPTLSRSDDHIYLGWSAWNSYFSENIIYITRDQTDSLWELADVVSDNVSSNKFRPSFAISPSGDTIYAIWRDNRDGNGYWLYVDYSWGPPWNNFNAFSGTPHDFAAIALDSYHPILRYTPGGYIHEGYASVSNRHIYLSEPLGPWPDENTGWGPDYYVNRTGADLETGGATEHGHWDMELVGSGPGASVFAVWAGDDGALWFRKSENDGGVGFQNSSNLASVISGSINPCSWASLDISSSGDTLFAVYRGTSSGDFGSTPYGDIYWCYSTDMGNSWSTPEVVDPGPNTDAAFPGVSYTDDGCGYVIWTRRSPGDFSGDIYYCKVCIEEPVFGERAESHQPTTDIGFWPYKTQLKLSLANTENVKLALYDGTGRLIRVLYTGRLEAGTHSFDVAGEGKGVYFAVLRYQNREKQAKLLIR